jgi:hypothetical protein
MHMIVRFFGNYGIKHLRDHFQNELSSNGLYLQKRYLFNILIPKTFGVSYLFKNCSLFLHTQSQHPVL